MTPAELQDLARLAALKRDRELRRVEQTMAQLNRLQADADDLTRARAARTGVGSLDAAMRMGADALWMARSGEKLARVQSQLAAIRAGHEVVLAEARRAFGRAEVVAQLARDARSRRPGG